MRRFLLAWCCTLLLAGCGRAAQPDEQALKSYLERYFTTWSAQDMEGYGACFHAQARISYVDRNGECRSQGLTDFLHSQKIGHETSASPMTEVPTDIKLSGDARVAQAAVRWRLVKGAEITTGTDYFTLVKTARGWKIITLVFYND